MLPHPSILTYITYKALLRQPAPEFTTFPQCLRDITASYLKGFDISTICTSDISQLTVTDNIGIRGATSTWRRDAAFTGCDLPTLQIGLIFSKESYDT